MGVDVDEDDVFSGYRDGDVCFGDFGEYVCGDEGFGCGLCCGGRLFFVLGL